MFAAVVEKLEGPSAIAVSEMQAPTAEKEDVVVKVHAVAPAFPDLLLSKGEYQIKPELPIILGSDFSGVVVDAPLNSAFQVGQKVAGCLSYGAAAELVAVPADRLYPIPDNISFEEAASLPGNYLTAYYALVTRGSVKQNEWVLVTGASGGVGQAAIQIAKGLGCRVIALVSSPEKQKIVLEAGADHAVLGEELPTIVKQLTDGHGVDVVVDVVGGDVTDLLRCLATFGRLMIVGFASGTIPMVKVNRLLLTNTDVRGVESARMWEDGQTAAAWNHIMVMYLAGFIFPKIQILLGLEEYSNVLVSIENRTTSGRAVISLNS